MFLMVIKQKQMKVGEFLIFNLLNLAFKDHPVVLNIVFSIGLPSSVFFFFSENFV